MPCLAFGRGCHPARSSAPTPTPSQTAETPPTLPTPEAALPIATPPQPEASAPEPVPPPSKESSLTHPLQAPDKEATVRFTVDISESVHRELSMLAAKTGRKKVDQSAHIVGGWIEKGGRVKAIVLAPSR